MNADNASMQSIVLNARKASRKMAGLDTDAKSDLLLEISRNIKRNKAKIIEANQLDMEAGRKMVAEKQLSRPLLDRLSLDDYKTDQLSVYLDETAKLDDPVGKRQFGMKISEDLELIRVSCPIGVVAVIFESRPEVVIQVSALSLKSGNAVILKGGREAGNSNRVLFELINEVLKKMDLSGAVNLIETREDVEGLLKMDDGLDLIIPRGSNEFVRYIQDNTKVPVLGHSSGVCHLYLDSNCDRQMAIPVVIDAKTDYPSACNAVETLLLHRDISPDFFSDILKKLFKAGVKLKGCPETLELARKGGFEIDPADESDWRAEYGDLVLAIKMIGSLDEAVEHINFYGSHHTDSIITEDKEAAERFLSLVDSSCVFHNASTRFSDGYVFGLGAEVGISTNKTHSRGPVGLEGMVIYKYLLRGKGQLRGDFSGENAKPYLHIPL